MNNEIKAWIITVIIFYSVFVLFQDIFFEYDDTDDKFNEIRSGMMLRIDYGTGCQYLESTWGHLEPRKDKNGNHICKQGD